jgi:hypothetical protein
VAAGTLAGHLGRLGGQLLGLARFQARQRSKAFVVNLLPDSDSGTMKTFAATR